MPKPTEPKGKQTDPTSRSKVVTTQRQRQTHSRLRLQEDLLSKVRSLLALEVTAESSWAFYMLAKLKQWQLS